MGLSKSAAKTFLDSLVPTVYAAEPAKRQQSKPAQNGVSDQRAQALGPAGAAMQNGLSPEQIQDVQNVISARDEKILKASTVSFSPLDDDLLHISCFQGKCFALGRSGAVFMVTPGHQWSYKLADFRGCQDHRIQHHVCFYSAMTQILYLKQSNTIFRCTPSNKPSLDTYSCDPKPVSTIKLEFGLEVARNSIRRRSD